MLRFAELDIGVGIPVLQFAGSEIEVGVPPLSSSMEPLCDSELLDMEPLCNSGLLDNERGTKLLVGVLGEVATVGVAIILPLFFRGSITF